MIGLGRWLHRQGRAEEAILLFERAMKRIEYDGVLPARRLDVLVSLAKHYERTSRDYQRALDMTLQALEIAEKEEFRRREARLRRKLGQGSFV